MPKTRTDPAEPEANAEETPARRTATDPSPALFIAKGSCMGAANIRPGEVAVEGANILTTHGHLFKPLVITYHA